MSARAWIWIGVFLLGAGGTGWFLMTHERVAEREWVGPSGEARLRPFLAAQRFAERMGMPGKEVRGLPDLDALPQRGVLILPAGRQALDALRVTQLVTWVENGGHLVVEAEHSRLPDAVLDRLGMGRSSQYVPYKPGPVVLANGRTLTALVAGQVLQGTARNVRLSVPAKDGWTLVSFERGRGLITAAANLSFARNWAIGEHDHAELFWHVLQLQPSQELRLYHRPERLSLWGFLKEHAAAVLGAAAALLVLWLWRIAPRFGPVAPDAPPSRRRLLDHLRASGRYFWSQGQRNRLALAARDAALRRIARTQPDFADAPPAERAARLALLAGIPPAQAARFIASGGELRGAAFIDLAHVAHRVHSALERGKT